MDTWLLIVLIAIGVLVILGIILAATGKADVVKKVILPLIGVLGAGAAAGKVLGEGSDDIRKENERIKEDLKKVEAERDDLREHTARVTEEHEENVQALQEDIADSDERVERAREDVETAKEQGPKEWYDSLPEEKKKEIQDKYKPSDVPDKYKNPS